MGVNGKQCLTPGSESVLNFLFKSLATQITQLFDVDCFLLSIQSSVGIRENYCT